MGGAHSQVEAERPLAKQWQCMDKPQSPWKVGLLCTSKW